MTTAMHGGCLCGGVRYKVAGPVIEAGYCHCRLCQLATGSPVAAFATVAIADYAPVKGKPTVRRSSDIGERWFCNQCGTPLAMRVDHQPATIDFTIATLDSPDLIRPTFHIWEERRLPWFETADTSERFCRLRPETPGLGPESVEARRL